MAFRNLAPSVIFEGIIKQNGTISDDAHVITRSWAKQNVINTIHPDSANYAEIVADGGVNKIKLKPLTITSVTVNSDQTSFANFISNVYTGANFQEGDIVFLTNAAISPTESYMNNGGTSNDASDWEKVNTGLSDAQIRAKFSASSGINYNSATGAFTADQGEIRAFFAGASGVSYNSSTGQISLDQAFSRGLVSASGLLSYNNGTGVFGLTDTAVRGTISADGAASNILTYNSGSGEIAVSKSSVRGLLSASGGILTYNSGTGAIDLQAAAIRGELSVDAGGLLSYNDATGVFNLTSATVRSQLTAGGLLSYSGGQFSLTDATVRGTLSAGGLLSYSGGQFSITDSTIRGTISADGAATNILTYNSGSGEMAVAKSSVRGLLSATGLASYDSATGAISVPEADLRKEFTGQNLVANTGLTLTHNLGKQLVHVSAMDGSGNDIELQKVYSNANSVQITSAVNLNGVTVAISI